MCEVFSIIGHVTGTQDWLRLLRGQDLRQGFVIRIQSEVESILIVEKLLYCPDDGKSFFADLGIPLLRYRHGPTGVCN